MVRGKLNVRGDDDDVGVMATAPCYGYEAAGAVQDQTQFLEEAEVFMRFQDLLPFNDPKGQPFMGAGWVQVRAVWNAS